MPALNVFSRINGFYSSFDVSSHSRTTMGIFKFFSAPDFTSTYVPSPYASLHLASSTLLPMPFFLEQNRTDGRVKGVILSPITGTNGASTPSNSYGNPGQSASLGFRSWKATWEMCPNESNLP
jgi:hypothetical protein